MIEKMGGLFVVYGYIVYSLQGTRVVFVSRWTVVDGSLRSESRAALDGSTLLYHFFESDAIVGVASR